MNDYDLFSRKIHYIKVGGSYQLIKPYRTQTAFRPEEDIVTERIVLLTSGLLVVLSGYCWDGTSGPVIDRQSNMRAGCGHDALYQLMRMKELDHAYWPTADEEFGKWLKEDGAWSITVKVDLLGLKIACGRAALPKNRKKVYVAG